MNKLARYFKLMKTARVFLVVSVLLVFAVQPVFAEEPRGGGTIVRCDPTAIQGEIGEQIFIDMYIQDVVELYGVDLILTFNPAIATVVDAAPFIPGTQIIPLNTFLVPGTTLFQEADNGTGEIHYTTAQLAPNQPVSGSGSVARIIFEGVTEGSFTMVYTFSELSTIDGVLIPHTTATCQVTIGNPTAVDLGSAAASGQNGGWFSVAAFGVLLLAVVSGVGVWAAGGRRGRL